MHHSSLQQSLLTQTKPNIETCGSGMWCTYMREQYSHTTLIKEQDQNTEYLFDYVKWQLYMIISLLLTVRKTPCLT